MSITILGLGPGDPQALTLEARDALAQAGEIYLRTREHPTVAALPHHLTIHTYDYLYEANSDFDTIYTAIAGDVATRGEQGDILYAVPGNPLFGETSVHKILAQARAKNIPVRVIPGLSFVDATCVALGLDPLAQGLQVVDATDLAYDHFPQLDQDEPTLVGQVYSRAVASDCKLTLLVTYPPDHSVTLVDAAGTPGQTMTTLPLEELDRSDSFGLLTTLYVPPLARISSLNGLAEIVAHLRSPEGCPWDREQTHESLRAGFLEEAYEVLETLDEGDMPHLREELGDMLLHVLLQTQIAEEASEFTLSDVVADIAAKLIRRHPHVFGSVTVSGTEEIIANWDKIKEKERGGKKRVAVSLPRGLPALAQAEKIAHHRKVKPSPSEIAERVEKLTRARSRDKALGEILYALAAFASTKHIDAESALRAAATRELNHHNQEVSDE
ncbi:MAG: MazG family protein [Chloroflexi bacterium]|nr:MazG family protein [Chloroflexota bacterium]